MVTRDQALDRRSGAGTAHAAEELRRDLTESVSGITNRKKDFLTRRPHCTACPLALRRVSPLRFIFTRCTVELPDVEPVGLEQHDVGVLAGRERADLVFEARAARLRR